jgi:protein TonB
MAYADLNTRSRNLPSIAGVAAVHALLGYALISGLATDFIKQVTPVFTVKSIEADPTPPPIPAAQPPKADPASEKVTSVALPADLPAIPREPVIVAVPGTGLERTVDPVVVPLPRLAPPQPQVSRAAGAQVQGNRATWITTDDYPSAALRAGDEGIVVISVRVGADGRVAGCTVTGSSGHPALDAATCRLYQRRARFTPSRDDAGRAIESSYTDRVRWELPQQ